MSKRAMIGPGLQWNTGIWFSVQLGSTIWMLLAAAWMAPLAPAVATGGLLCFALPNGLGTWMWWRRDQIAPFSALLLLTLLICGSSLLLILTFDWFWPVAIPREPLWLGYATFIFSGPAMMVRWYGLERTATKGIKRTGCKSNGVGAT